MAVRNFKFLLVALSLSLASTNCGNDQRSNSKNRKEQVKTREETSKDVSNKTMEIPVTLVDNKLKFDPNLGAVADDLNAILKRMDLKYVKIESVHVDSQGVGFETVYDPTLYKRLYIGGKVLRSWPGRNGFSPPNPETFAVRNLVMPNLSETQSAKLKTEYEQNKRRFVFSDSSSPRGEPHWTVKLSYRDLLEDEFKAQAIHVYRKTAAGEALDRENWGNNGPVDQTKCATIQQLVENFISESFSDVGVVSNFTCTTKTIPLVSEKITVISFSIGNSKFTYDQGVVFFPHLVKDLLSLRFDLLIN